MTTGDRLPEFTLRPTLRHAVMYAAAMWEFQRIHYDAQWARDKEGLPGAVVQGPVLGNYLAQAIAHWTGPAAVLKHLEWRNHGLVAFGDVVRCQGTVTAKHSEGGVPDGADVRECLLECALEMINQRGEKVVSGSARVGIELGTLGRRAA